MYSNKCSHNWKNQYIRYYTNLNSDYSILFHNIQFYFNSLYLAGHHRLTLLFFHWENLRKFPKNLRKYPETSGKPPENSEDGGKLRKCKCIYAAHKQETFSAPWTVWSCGIRLYARKSASGVLTVYYM
jgi:hypothetical protein